MEARISLHGFWIIGVGSLCLISSEIVYLMQLIIVSFSRSVMLDKVMCSMTLKMVSNKFSMSHIHISL